MVGFNVGTSIDSEQIEAIMRKHGVDPARIDSRERFAAYITVVSTISNKLLANFDMDGAILEALKQVGFVKPAQATLMEDD